MATIAVYLAVSAIAAVLGHGGRWLSKRQERRQDKREEEFVEQIFRTSIDPEATLQDWEDLVILGKRLDRQHAKVWGYPPPDSFAARAAARRDEVEVHLINL